MAKSTSEHGKKSAHKKNKGPTSEEQESGVDESQSYQQMLEQVESIVRSIGSSSLDLDEVVTKVEEGYKLISRMRGRLDATKAKVEALRSEFESGATGSSNKPGNLTKNSTKNDPEDSKDQIDEDSEDDDAPF
ncbi:MAG: exodeoxyribonuclease VII small subunit [Proteobacteria bacterium]|nr:exodeoxyribonuclease VII small subunit [Pseudomonadota bacterium]